MQFWKDGMPDLSQAYLDIPPSVPPEKKRVHSPSLVGCGEREKNRGKRWFTFPIASQRRVREHYARQAYANARPVDILIIENGGARQPDKYGIYPTFAITPPDPGSWRHLRNHKRIFGADSPRGIDLSPHAFIR